jgi:hypothetical protein
MYPGSLNYAVDIAVYTPTGIKFYPGICHSVPGTLPSGSYYDLIAPGYTPDIGTWVNYRDPALDIGPTPGQRYRRAGLVMANRTPAAALGPCDLLLIHPDGTTSLVANVGCDVAGAHYTINLAGLEGTWATYYPGDGHTAFPALITHVVTPANPAASFVNLLVFYTAKTYATGLTQPGAQNSAGTPRWGPPTW